MEVAGRPSRPDAHHSAAQRLGTAAGRFRQGRRTPQSHRPVTQCAGGLPTPRHHRPQTQFCGQPGACRLRCVLRRAGRTQCVRQYQWRLGPGRVAHGQQGLCLASVSDLRQAVAVHPGQCAPDLEAGQARLHPDRPVYQGTGRGRQGGGGLLDSSAFRPQPGRLHGPAGRHGRWRWPFHSQVPTGRVEPGAG